MMMDFTWCLYVNECSHAYLMLLDDADQAAAIAGGGADAD